MKLLGAILRWLGNLLDPVADTTAASSFQIGVTTDVGAVANFVTECVKAGMDIMAFLDSPQMTQARTNAEVQAARDQNALDAAQALKSGNADQINKDLS